MKGVDELVLAMLVLDRTKDNVSKHFIDGMRELPGVAVIPNNIDSDDDMKHKINEFLLDTSKDILIYAIKESNRLKVKENVVWISGLLQAHNIKNIIRLTISDSLYR